MVFLPLYAPHFAGVVCGTSTGLLRHNIIPHLYRQLFPLRMKSHSSHDVVLLCAVCHAQADMRNDELRHCFVQLVGRCSDWRLPSVSLPDLLGPRRVQVGVGVSERKLEIDRKLIAASHAGESVAVRTDDQTV